MAAGLSKVKQNDNYGYIVGVGMVLAILGGTMLP